MMYLLSWLSWQHHSAMQS